VTLNESLSSLKWDIAIQFGKDDNDSLANFITSSLHHFITPALHHHFFHSLDLSKHFLLDKNHRIAEIEN